MLPQQLLLLPSPLCYSLLHGAANINTVTACYFHRHCHCGWLIVTSLLVSAVDCCISMMHLAYAAATALAITACAAPCATVLPAPLMLPSATIIAI